MMQATVKYLDGSQDSGEIERVRVDGQFITIFDADGDQTIVNGNAIKCVLVST